MTGQDTNAVSDTVAITRQTDESHSPTDMVSAGNDELHQPCTFNTVMSHAVRPRDYLNIVAAGDRAGQRDIAGCHSVDGMARVRSSVTDDEHTCSVRPASRRHGNEIQSPLSDATERRLTAVEDASGGGPAGLLTSTTLLDRNSQSMQSVSADSQTNVMPDRALLAPFPSTSHSQRTCPALCHANEQRAASQSRVTGCHCDDVEDTRLADITHSAAAAGIDAYCQHLMPASDFTASETHHCGAEHEADYNNNNW